MFSHKQANTIEEEKNYILGVIKVKKKWLVNVYRKGERIKTTHKKTFF